MKNDCNVVRDLMPLVIDGASSEESVKLVEAHMAECEPCTAIYAELQEELHAETSAREQVEFEKAARKLRKARRLRISLLVLLVAVAVGAGVWWAVPKHDSGLLPLRAVEVQLLRMPDSDRVCLLVLPKKEGQSIGFTLTNDIRSDGLYHVLMVEDTAGTPYVPYYRFLLDDMYVLDGGVLHTTYKGRPLSAVVQFMVTDGYAEKVLYMTGAELPWASTELADYIKAEDAFRAFRQQDPDVLDNDQWLKKYQALEAEVERLEPIVPEFKIK